MRLRKFKTLPSEQPQNLETIYKSSFELHISAKENGYYDKRTDYFSEQLTTYG